MSQEKTSKLNKFVQQTFGRRCADLLLLGLGESEAKGPIKLVAQDALDDMNWELQISVAGGTLPCYSEPLVLAVLLKLLLKHDPIPSYLEFYTSEVVGELRHIGVALTESDIDRIISKYAALTIDKRVKDESISDGGGGVYPLITSYVRGSAKRLGATPIRYSCSLFFEDGFVEGLREGKVIIAGINFGKLGNFG